MSVNFLGIGNPALNVEEVGITLSVSSSDSQQSIVSSRALGSLPRLPETGRELRRFSSIIEKNNGRSDLLLGEDATETALKSTSLENYQIIAIATHGVNRRASRTKRKCARFYAGERRQV